MGCGHGTYSLLCLCLAGLTTDYLESASQEKLILAALNLEMLDSIDDTDATGAGVLRKKLHMFVMFGKAMSKSR